MFLLELGNRVPADIRLFETHGFFVDESLLTGESFAVEKKAEWVGQESEVLADRVNIAHAGSIVTRGRARGWVVATAQRTSVGALALDVMTTAGGKSPLLANRSRIPLVSTRG